MRRKVTSFRGGQYYVHTLKSFSRQQLEEIGAVAVTFNDAERALHELLGAALRFPGQYEVVASRINGMDGIAAIIREAAKNLVRLDAARVQQAIGYWRDLDLSLARLIHGMAGIH
jgi:hypothetical protein